MTSSNAGRPGKAGRGCRSVPASPYRCEGVLQIPRSIIANVVVVVDDHVIIVVSVFNRLIFIRVTKTSHDGFNSGVHIMLAKSPSLKAYCFYLKPVVTQTPTFPITHVLF